MEFTLEDTLEMLKDTQMERVQQIDALVAAMSEMDPSSIKGKCGSDEIRTKQQKMCYSLLKEVVQEETKDYPIPGTPDLHIDVLRELEEEIRKSRDLLESVKNRLSSIQEDISYLQNKKTGLEKMKQAYLEHEELTANTQYTAEQIISKRIFQAVKSDLDDVVNVLFPDRQDFRNFLSMLTSSYAKSGDDVYVDIMPEVTQFANFLIDADIAVYHRNDLNKIRLMDMI